MTFKILVCGDSIAWGQGLEDHQKYSTLVEDFLQNRWDGTEIVRLTAAHSGAIIGIGKPSFETPIDQEVPVDDPTIFQQVMQYREKPEEATDVGLVLINGGINDVNIRTILNPTTPEGDLRNQTRIHCYDDMLMLLSECSLVFPNARIVATGYYPLVSNQSPTAFLLGFANAVGLPLLSITGAIVGVVLSKWAHLQMVHNSFVFAEAANLYLQMAVNEINQIFVGQGQDPKVALASPDYKEENAFMAPKSYLFGLKSTLDPTELFLPVDTISRVSACHTAKDSGRITDYAQCKLASAGHPNPMGAQAYFNAIFAILDQWLLQGWHPGVINVSQNWMSLLLSDDD
jgi:hypothetical protein